MALFVQRRLVWLGAAALLALASGCTPKIGDKCTVSTDCSVNGDRLCDSTEPGGYCTVFNCEPNACPGDSVCVAFDEPSCSSPAQSVRFTRTFCMATCESDGECRAGYLCIDVAADPSRLVLDVNPSSRRICAVASKPPPSPEASSTEPAVCAAFAFDGSLPEASTSIGDAGDAAVSTAPDATGGDAPNADVVIDTSGDGSATSGDSSAGDGAVE